MPVLVVMFENCTPDGGGGGGGLFAVPELPPPPPQLTAAPAQAASAAARHAFPAPRLMSLVAIPEPQTVFARLAPLVRCHRSAVERLSLDRLVRRIGHERFGVPLA